MDKYYFECTGHPYFGESFRIRHLNYVFSDWLADKETAFQYYSTLRRFFPIELLDVVRLFIPMFMSHQPVCYRLGYFDRINYRYG